MLKRRSRWLAVSGAMLLALSLSGMVVGAEPVVANPVVAVDTTATFEDLNGDGIDDDCTVAVEVLDQVAVDAEVATVDTNADGVISTSEAAQSPRTGGKNCNHGGYVSWIAHQNHNCVVDEPVVEPTVDEVVTTPPDAEPDVTVDACEPAADGAARAAIKAERALAREAAKTAREVARDAAKAERTAARDAAKAERAAARDARKAAHAAWKATKAHGGGH
jgi:hypothetical protein